MESTIAIKTMSTPIYFIYFDLLVSTINLILLRFMYLSYSGGWVEKMPPPLLVPEIIKQEDINSIRIDCAHVTGW
jgi:hypothetical protein